MSTRDTFIQNAVAALGGLDRLHSIRTFHARALLLPEGVKVEVWRAAGGRICIREESGAQARTTLVVGSTGVSIQEAGDERTVSPLADPEVAAVRRAARLAPRNLLAHSAEYDLYLALETTHLQGKELLALDLPSESVRYFFDSVSHLCLAMVDGDSRVEFEDYQTVGGIPTPMTERHGSTLWRWLLVEYNPTLPERLFDLG